MHIDYKQMLHDYLDLTTTEMALCTHLDKLKYGDFIVSNNNDKKSVAEELNDLLMNKDIFRNYLNMDNSYLICILNDELKVAQYSNKYILDDLTFLKNFVLTYDDNFLKKLYKTTFISDKEKYKIISKTKNKEKIIYDNNNIGVEILDIINGKSDFKLKKHKIQNCIVDNINNTDNLEKKIIIILNFDVKLFELYYSIPYKMYQQGSEQISDDDYIYSCMFEDIDIDIISEKIEEYARFA